MFRRLVQMLIPKPKSVGLGRWSLKHNSHKCEEYFRNYYGEPGYPNADKKEWIKKMKIDEDVKLK